MGLLELPSYEINANKGFLAHYEPAAVELPHNVMPVRELALRLPQLVPTGEVRRHINALPKLELSEFIATASTAQQRTLMVHYSFMVQSYIWGESKVIDFLPECLALPFWQLGEAIQQPPILTYSNYVLDNWGLVDPDGSIDLNNIFMLQPFIGGQDEAWFVLIHVAIEAAAGKMLVEYPAMVNASVRGDTEALEDGFETIVSTWAEINAIFDRMPERCDPYIYFHRVRPWIHGWKDNPALPDGVTYRGVDDERAQNFRGQTGSQSSIVPSMDALLGINHAEDPLRHYLDELHVYRPPSHRRFIDDVRAASQVRQVVQAVKSRQLTELYNECLERLATFRTKHLEYAASYIAKQNKGGVGNNSDVGTGGTPFMKYLKKHRDEVEQQRL